MKSRAEIKREEFTDHPMQEGSTMNLKLAGSNITPFGFEYQGSVAVHYYQRRGTTNFVFASQLTGLDKIPEGQTDLGLKELRRAMMGVYGRKDVRREGYEG